jgi:hypothetical protein
MTLQPKYRCDACDYSTSKKCNWSDHIETVKHKRLYLLKTPEQKPVITFDCSLCDVKCSHISILNRHKNTKLHKKKAENAVNIQSKESDDDILKTENQVLRNLIIEQTKTYTESMTKAIEKNNDIMNKFIECFKAVNQTTINQTNNNNNQKFNINVFLNEQCKDAMNFSDFIKNIEVSREDLENNAQLGFVGGVSKIFLDNLQQLSINERPIHCTDIKRGTMYIKDDDKWTKEEDCKKLNSAIQTITQKSTRTLLDWKKVNPDYQDHDSAFSTRCLVIQRNSMAGYDRDTYYPKVIKAIAKEVVV